METGVLIELICVTILMVFWLGFVVTAAILAIRKMDKSEGLRRKQFFYLGFATIVVFIGDVIHTLGFDLSLSIGDPLGIIELSTWGSNRISYNVFIH